MWLQMSKKLYAINPLEKSVSFFDICLPFSFHCSYVLQELVETERDYVRDLGYVVEVWCF